MAKRKEQAEYLEIKNKGTLFLAFIGFAILYTIFVVAGGTLTSITEITVVLLAMFTAMLFVKVERYQVVE